MSRIAEILEGKSRDVISVDHEATVYATVKAMVDANVGAVLVTDGDTVTGIFTERDFLRRVAAEELPPRETRVRDVMTAPVLVVNPETSVEEVMALMSDRRIRHAPVMNEGALVGMISIGDLVNFQSRQQTFQIQYLQDYITAR
jgi:CBS domain-containing protein